MRKLSDKIHESESTTMYEYVVQATLKGTVTAGTDSEAGELVDKQMDEIISIADYNIESLDVVTMNENVDETLLSPEDKVDELIFQAKNDMSKYIGQLTNATERNLFREKMIDAINTFVDQIVM